MRRSSATRVSDSPSPGTAPHRLRSARIEPVLNRSRVGPSTIEAATLAAARLRPAPLRVRPAFCLGALEEDLRPVERLLEVGLAIQARPLLVRSLRGAVTPLPSQTGPVDRVQARLTRAWKAGTLRVLNGSFKTGMVQSSNGFSS